jgi:hypothetical protein
MITDLNSLKYGDVTVRVKKEAYLEGFANVCNVYFTWKPENVSFFEDILYIYKSKDFKSSEEVYKNAVKEFEKYFKSKILKEEHPEFFEAINVITRW